MTMRSLSIGLLLIATACATTASARDEAEDPAVTKALAGKTPGKPQSCLPIRASGSSQTFNGTVLYRVSRNLTYRNDMGGRCTGLGFDRIAIVQIYGSSQLCRGDIVTFGDRQTGAQFAGCAFGDFVPYRTDPAKP